MESNFGTYDGNQRCFTTAAPENISGMSQQARMKDFNHGQFVRSDRRKSKPAEPGAAAGADEADIGYLNHNSPLPNSISRRLSRRNPKYLNPFAHGASILVMPYPR